MTSFLVSLAAIAVLGGGSLLKGLGKLAFIILLALIFVVFNAGSA